MCICTHCTNTAASLKTQWRRRRYTVKTSSELLPHDKHQKLIRLIQTHASHSVCSWNTRVHFPFFFLEWYKTAQMLASHDVNYLRPDKHRHPVNVCAAAVRLPWCIDSDEWWVMGSKNSENIAGHPLWWRAWGGLWYAAPPPHKYKHIMIHPSGFPPLNYYFRRSLLFLAADLLNF